MAVMQQTDVYLDQSAAGGQMRIVRAASAHSLDGTVALIAGACAGMGPAICSALCEAGARVVGSGAECDECSAAGFVDCWLPHDVTSAEGWARIAAEIRWQFGRLDCLIYGAEAPLDASLADVGLEQWRCVFSTNVEGLLLGMHATLPLLIESGRYGRGGSSIVSFCGASGPIRNVSYSASKGALALLIRSAAAEFEALRYPIRINGIRLADTTSGATAGALSPLKADAAGRTILAYRRRLASPVGSSFFAHPQRAS